MTPTEIGVMLGHNAQGTAVLAAITKTSPTADAALVVAIRASFKKGEEQGNARRLEAVIRLEGEGALDLIVEILTTSTRPASKFTNLNNSTLALIQANFLGHPALATALWRAVEDDPYLNIVWLYPVAAAYDPARALALLLPVAEKGFGPALQFLAAVDRPRVRTITKGLLADPDKALHLITALGPLADDPEIAAMVLPLAETVPSAAAVALEVEPARAPALVDKLLHKSADWHDVGARALALLPPAEVFDRASPWFAAEDRNKPAMRRRLERICQYTRVPFVDPRWLPFFTERLEVEDLPAIRELLIYALRNVGLPALDLILAPRAATDKGALKALSFVLAYMRDLDVTERVRTALKTAKGKHKTQLARALKALTA